MQKSPFTIQDIGTTSSNKNSISFDDANVVFVSDFFKDEYLGGAELSTEALFETSPLSVYKLKSQDLNQDIISKGSQKIWVFFNFSSMNLNLIPSIVGNCFYYIVEYDYKFCKYRSIEKHEADTGEPCDCDKNQYGMFISAFFTGSEHIFWMSEQQKQIYCERFDFLNKKASTVLSSIFSVSDLEYIESLRKSREDNFPINSFVIMNSNSWIKGVEETKTYLKNKEVNFEIVGGLKYHDMLSKLSNHKGLAFHPLGGDTCPRLVIEAKLLGLEIDVNENVQHTKELWWQKSIDEIESYLLEGHNRFWGSIMKFLEKEPKVSGYTTVKDVIEQNYPWRACISSMLDFCDEVIVVDGGSKDGSYEELLKWETDEPKLKVHKVERDWNHKRFAVFDGLQKAAAREFCSYEWCWQQDIDEVVHEDDAPKIKRLAKTLPKNIHILALPVVEYWGSNEKVRVDVNPWKWRLTRNLPHITHGVPSELRKTDSEGDLYSLPGTDGCDFIDKETFKRLNFANFYTQEVDQARKMALQGSEDHVKAYEKWMNALVDELPGVHHYSWYNINRKINTYKNYWQKHWESLFDIKQEDSPENNMFFNKSWKDVTDKEIDDMTNKLEEEMGGWIFHRKVDFNKPTPSIRLNRAHPKHINEWKND